MKYCLSALLRHFSPSFLWSVVNCFPLILGLADGDIYLFALVRVIFSCKVPLHSFTALVVGWIV